jgi:hypothetical protein
MQFYKITPANATSFYAREPITGDDIQCVEVPVSGDTEHFLTIAEIRQQAIRFCNFLEKFRGYNSASFSYFDTYNYSTTVYLMLEDDFQKNIPREDRCESGLISISCERLFSDWSTWISREMRELHVMAAKVSTDPELLSQVQSAQAKQFVQDLMDKSVDLKKLLAAPRASV